MTRYFSKSGQSHTEISSATRSKKRYAMAGSIVESSEMAKQNLECDLVHESREATGRNTTRLVQKSLYTATNGERQRIHYFHVEKWNGRIRSTEAERVYWESEVSNLSIIPDRRAVQKILRVQHHRK